MALTTTPPRRRARPVRTARHTARSAHMPALPTVRDLPPGAAHAIADPTTTDDDLLALLEAHPVPGAYTALLHRPGRPHPALLRAAAGTDATSELLHYAVKDATAPTLDRALTLSASTPSTRQVLAPALVVAPNASADQLATLVRQLATNGDAHTAANIELLDEALARLPQDVADDVTHVALSDPRTPHEIAAHLTSIP